MNKERMLQNLIKLCNVPSISETSGENEAVKKVYELIMEIDYFKKNPDNTKIHTIKGDKLNRTYASAFLEGKKKSSKTVLLLSHLDVVSVEEFGNLKEFAFDPLLYTEKLKASEGITMPAEAKADLESGDYLFGRGTMDMKYGIAADIEILYKASEDIENFEGNILLVSVPDEEANSAGMLGAVEFLLSLKEEKKLEYRGAIISEPFFSKYPGDTGKYIYTGTVGKLLPLFYCVGKETHVCEPFSGLSPNLLTGKLLEYIEQNPELSDHIENTYVPAPMCLKQSDTKEEYSVQIPTAAYSYFNVMTLYSTPEDIMDKMMDIANKAFSEVIADKIEKAKKLEKIIGNKITIPEIKPKVISYSELYEICEEAHGEEFKNHIKDFVGNSNISDLRQLTVEVVKETHKYCPDRNPMIIICFAPPYYPHSKRLREDSHVLAVVDTIIKRAKAEYNENYQIEPFFSGLSDMSYLGLSEGIDIHSLRKNFPLWGDNYSVPLNIIAKLNIPFICLGPLGKDAHKYTERLCLSYSFEKAAPLIYAAAKEFLK